MRQGRDEKRCAVYTRKSTDERLDTEFNLLDAQYDACTSYIKSQVGMGWWLVYSGGTMNRPALAELIKDIEAGKIDVVVVYKIDRLDRSLCDFTDLSKLFEQHGVSFVSVTQQIDTSNAAGRMMLNIPMSFAQFEREMTADCIRDKIYASRKRGITGASLRTSNSRWSRRRRSCPPPRIKERRWKRKRLRRRLIGSTRE